MPNEKMKSKYAPDGFEMPEKQLERETKEEGKEGEEKPKYNAKNDFFDSLTNSTLEERKPQRGGRGRGRGDWNNRGDFNNRGGEYRGRGGNRGEWRGRGRGNYDNNFDRGFERRPKYSDNLRDPNADLHRHADRPQEEGDERTKGFFDHMKNEDTRSYRGRGGRGRGGYEHRGGFEGNRGGFGEHRGGFHRGGRGGFHNQERREQRDNDTFGAISKDFKTQAEQQDTSKRGGRGVAGAKPARTQNDKYPVTKDQRYQQKEPIVDDGHKDFFDTKKPRKAAGGEKRAQNRFAGMDGSDSNEEK